MSEIVFMAPTDREFDRVVGDIRQMRDDIELIKEWIASWKGAMTVVKGIGVFLGIGSLAGVIQAIIMIRDIMN